MFSLLDMFLGYNQTLTSKNIGMRLCFMQSGIFSLTNEAFGLINVGATYQRVIDVYFIVRINKSIIVYLDDVTIYSKNRANHTSHFTQFLKRCSECGISPNPKRIITLYYILVSLLLDFYVLPRNIFLLFPS